MNKALILVLTTLLVSCIQPASKYVELTLADVDGGVNRNELSIVSAPSSFIKSVTPVNISISDVQTVTGSGMAACRFAYWNGNDTLIFRAFGDTQSFQGTSNVENTSIIRLYCDDGSIVDAKITATFTANKINYRATGIITTS